MRRLPLVIAVLLLPAPQAAAAAFGGTNGPIAFEGQGAVIGTVNADGTLERGGVISAGATDRDPSWSADGRRLAFTSTRDRNEEIYVFDSETGSEQRLTRDAARDFDPCWSPDGTRIAFTSTRHGNPEIYVMPADGQGAPERLTFDPAVDQQPSWSQQGYIAFASARAGNLDIHLMDDRGGGLRQVTADPAPEADPSWSPEGSRIAFTRGGFPFLDIFVVAPGAGGPGSSDVRRLTTAIGADQFPAWSPDGTRLAFTSDRFFRTATFVMPAEGEEAAFPVRVASGVDPSWGPLPPPAPEGPEAGETITVDRAGGRVLVAPGTREEPSEDAVARARLTEEAEIPVRSTIDATGGTVEILAETITPAGAPTIGRALVSGLFTITQAAGGPPTMRLAAPGPRRCGARAARVATDRIVVRSRGGRFRGRTGYGAGNGRGTRWTMQARCDGTIFRVREGIVDVTDFRLRKTVAVRAGRCYLASAAPRRGAGRARRTCPRVPRGR